MDLGLTQQEQAKFIQVFQEYGPVDGFLSGESCFKLFSLSGLQREQLRDIWELSDIDKDGRLDFSEFCVAMKLITSVKSGELGTLPKSLPQNFIPNTKKHLLSTNFGSEEKIAAELTPSMHNKTRSDVYFDQYANGQSTVSLTALGDFLKTSGKPWNEIMKLWNTVDVYNVQRLTKDQFGILMDLMEQNNFKFLDDYKIKSTQGLLNNEQTITPSGFNDMFGISEMKSFETQRTSDTMGKGKARESASIADNYITRVKSNSSGLSSPLHGVPTYKSNSRSRDELYRSGTELNRSETDPAFKSYLEHKTKVRKFSEHLVGVVKKRMTGINEESNSDELKRRNDCLVTHIHALEYQQSELRNYLQEIESELH